MDKQEITRKIIVCVAESLARPTEGIGSETSLIKELDADSLDFLDIMFSLERTFKITLGKEHFDLLQKVGMSREEAIVGQNLTQPALDRLQAWLPTLPKEGNVPVRNLRDYITVETIVRIVQQLIQEKGA